MNYRGYFFVIALFVLLFSPFIYINAAPDLLYPTDSDSPIWKGVIEFKWNNTETELSQYHINLPNGTALDKIISTSSISTYDLEIGTYNWAVRSCEDTNCGSWSDSQTFNIIMAPSGTSSGLVICGTEYDNPDTLNNESEPCSIPHLFLLLNNLLNFALWKLGLLIIGVMAVITATMSYLSFGSPEILIQIKAAWKYILIGYLVMLLSWLAINVILDFFGLKFQWWAI